MDFATVAPHLLGNFLERFRQTSRLVGCVSTFCRACSMAGSFFRLTSSDFADRAWVRDDVAMRDERGAAILLARHRFPRTARTVADLHSFAQGDAQQDGKRIVRQK